eukprot:comp22782_c1_seq1/m.35667 comp22782_c1_seq1/g.35667  ORF comp22782_c1_seq1/g.35667 comp22782_c1_seq1/m.35667 type:complete len:705 (-) comp22782_c1_seq1:46-2160(-)
MTTSMAKPPGPNTAHDRLLLNATNYLDSCRRLTQELQLPVQLQPPKSPVRPGPRGNLSRQLRGTASPLLAPEAQQQVFFRQNVNVDSMGETELREYMKEMQAELNVSNSILNMIERVDDVLEDAIAHNWSMATLMNHLLPTGFDQMEGSEALWVRTLDETQQYVDFVYPLHERQAFGIEREDIDAVFAEIKSNGEFKQVINGVMYVGTRLDVSDTYLGGVLVKCCDSRYPPNLVRTLVRWGEMVDNFIGDTARARRKHIALRQLSKALRNPILDEALDKAIQVVREYVPFVDLVLVVSYESIQTVRVQSSPRPSVGALRKLSRQFVSLPALTAKSMDGKRERIVTRKMKNLLNFRIVKGDGQVTGMKASDSVDSLDEMALTCFSGDTAPLVERCSLVEGMREEFEIFTEDGVTLAGKMTVGVDQPLTPYCRDILLRLSDFISQRLSAFNKEWKQLSRNFAEAVVRQLLREHNYFEKYLSPREQMVAIVYVDIAGFTWLSETLLKEPSLIGKLIDKWSNQAVQYIWESGGVFDKMVGDCIIGLWGPPFFREPPRVLCAKALEAACKIRSFTRSLLTDGKELPMVAERRGERDMGVSIGINYCPLMVGVFGPDRNYTGFSSGMNNTARLQGLATCNEILCMDAFVDAYGQMDVFSEERAGKVKNVAEPIKYRAYLPARDDLTSGPILDDWTLQIDYTPARRTSYDK